MNFELTGKLTEKFETIQVSDKFKKREFVLESIEQAGSIAITNIYKFTLKNDRCSLIDQFEKNTELKVSFNIKGSRSEKNGKVYFFTDLEAWRIEHVGAVAIDHSSIPEPPTNIGSDSADNDVLPF